MTTSRAPHAIIFDLDGTLVDTVGTRVDSWMAVFPRFGIEPDPGFLAPLMGSDGKYLARMTAEHYGVELQPGDDAQIDIQAGAEFRVLNANPRALPAARELLEALTDRGLPWAVATSSLPDDARESVQSLGLRSFRPQVSACPGCGRTTSTFFQEMAQRIDEEIRQILDVAYQQATEIVIENSDKLEALAEKLLDVETVNRTEFVALMG